MEGRDYRRFRDPDWSNVTQKLREKYFSQHLTVAIIGVKNSFYGEIYDVGLNAAAFSYTSGDAPARYRPFYLFLMGSEPQVRTFLESWKAKMPSEKIKYVVFSEYLATYTPDTKNTSKINLFSDGKLKKADSRLQEAGIADREEEAIFTLHGKLEKNAYSCKLVNENLNPTIKVFAWIDTVVKGESVETDKEEAKNEEGSLLNKITFWFGKDEEIKKEAVDNSDENIETGKEGAWQEQDSKDAASVFIWSDETDKNGNNCTLDLTFQPGMTLPWGRIGLIQVQVVPTRESLQLPEWISEWDMGDIDTAPEKFDGAKTVNLKRIAS